MNCKNKNDINPLVSIVIPVYNGSNYMREAIDSALNQTYENIEVIVVNDGSNDDGKTRNIALSYGNRIRYFEKENGGVSSALNLGIKQMKGTYFSWLSHDDVYCSRKIENQIELLKTIPHNNCVAMCRMAFIDRDSNHVGKPKRHKERIYGKEVPWEKALEWHIKVGSFGGCNLLIPKSAFERCGLFDESLRYVQDFLMWIKIFKEGYSLICSEEFDVLNRVHQQQLTIKGKELFKKESEIVSKLIVPNLLEISTPEHNYLYFYLIYNAKYGNYDVVRKGIDYKAFSLMKKIKLCSILLYSLIRPHIKVIYYKITKK